MMKRELDPDCVYGVICGKTIVNASTHNSLVGILPGIKIVFTDNTVLLIESGLSTSQHLRYYFFDEIDRFVKESKNDV